MLINKHLHIRGSSMDAILFVSRWWYLSEPVMVGWKIRAKKNKHPQFLMNHH